MESAGVDGGLLAGQLNAAIANEIGKLTADFTGRGSEKSRAFITWKRRSWTQAIPSASSRCAMSSKT